MKHIILSIIACAIISLFPVVSRAQIGYQVSLLNTATGEPRAGVTVNATVTISDSSDKVIYTGTQQATSNDFGVLSLTVGNADTFSKADFGKLPFFISVSVDGALIGKSQILSVPVAEYAKRTGELTVDKLVGTWKHINEDAYGYESEYYLYLNTFFKDGTCNETASNYLGITKFNRNGTYFIDSNNIWINYANEYGTSGYHMFYISSKNMLGDNDGELYTKQ